MGHTLFSPKPKTQTTIGLKYFHESGRIIKLKKILYQMSASFCIYILVYGFVHGLGYSVWIEGSFKKSKGLNKNIDLKYWFEQKRFVF